MITGVNLGCCNPCEANVVSSQITNAIVSPPVPATITLNFDRPVLIDSVEVTNAISQACVSTVTTTPASGPAKRFVISAAVSCSSLADGPYSVEVTWRVAGRRCAKADLQSQTFSFTAT